MEKKPHPNTIRNSALLNSPTSNASCLAPINLFLSLIRIAQMKFTTNATMARILKAQLNPIDWIIALVARLYTIPPIPLPAGNGFEKDADEKSGPCAILSGQVGGKRGDK
ncbi:MAG: hypothetical protein Q9187_006848 [Circinaria calcarea]